MRVPCRKSHNFGIAGISPEAFAAGDYLFLWLRRQMANRRPPLPAGFYERIAAELEEIADRLEERPELNHGAAEKLREIAKDIRQDAKSLG
jgi:hypothetical protein